MGGRGPGNIRPWEHGVIVGGCGDLDACQERGRIGRRVTGEGVIRGWGGGGGRDTGGE